MLIAESSIKKIGQCSLRSMYIYRYTWNVKDLVHVSLQIVQSSGMLAQGVGDVFLI